MTRSFCNVAMFDLQLSSGKYNDYSHNYQIIILELKNLCAINQRKICWQSSVNSRVTHLEYRPSKIHCSIIYGPLELPCQLQWILYMGMYRTHEYCMHAHLNYQNPRKGEYSNFLSGNLVIWCCLICRKCSWIYMIGDDYNSAKLILPEVRLIKIPMCNTSNTCTTDTQTQTVNTHALDERFCQC